MPSSRKRQREEHSDRLKKDKLHRTITIENPEVSQNHPIVFIPIAGSFGSFPRDPCQNICALIESELKEKVCPVDSFNVSHFC
jgi:hypothetical protein